jgi:uncharacterized protein (TIGR04222 family)
MNPLNWTAGPFLSLYTSLAGTTLLLLWWWKTRLGAATASTANLSTLQLAYLAGGDTRAVNTILVALLESQAATIKTPKTIAIDHTATLPEEWRAFLGRLPAQTDRSGFAAALSAACARVRDDLAVRGLVATRAERTAFRWLATATLAGPLALGVMKIIVGSQRGRPVGILSVLVCVTVGLGFVLIQSGPFRTPAGAQALARARTQKARAARAPLTPEIPLAYALTGVSVLAGRHYQPFFVTTSSGSSSGCGSSGCGGGGGGCGGCGG